MLAASIPSEIPVTKQEEIDSEADSPSLNFEMRQLKTVLQLLEEEIEVLQTKLSNSEQEVIQLKQELMNPEEGQLNFGRKIVNNC